VVESFDAPRGLGVVVDTSGERWPFHCTALTDGSREIAPETEVVFVVAPGALGRMEARRITAGLPDPRSSPH
jgi:hypothetical protein